MLLFRKTTLMFLALILFGSFIFSNLGIAKNLAPSKGIASTNPAYGTGSTSLSFIIKSTQYLKEGNNYIQLISDNIVTVGGNTQAYSTVDEIVLALYLQRWDDANSRWVDVLYIGEFAQFNSSFVNGAKDITVPKGYYYRTRSYHSILEGGTLEQMNVYSSYIYVP